MVDISRQTTGVALPEEVSSEIWANAVESSLVMSTARRIAMPGPGITIHSITGEPVAEWVAETASKPVSRHTLDNKSITPYKLAVIEPFSDEFRRDLPGLYTEMVRRLPFALAKKFDTTVFSDGTGYSQLVNFDFLGDTATTQSIDGTDNATILADLVAAYQKVSDADGDINAWIASPKLVGKLITALSTSKDFDLSSSLQVGSVFGAPVYKTRAALPTGTPNTLGYAGDFQADAVWGSVEGVSISISDQATLEDGTNTINLWQQNMFAVRAEIEVGFRVSDVDRFIRLDDGATGGA